MESTFLKALQERVLVLDGAMGTSVHSFHLPLSDYLDLENCTEILCQTRPDVVREIHRRFLEVGCDAVETNTFGANRIIFAEFGIEDQVRELNRVGAQIAREAVAEFSTPSHPRFVIGSIGPGTRLVSLRQTTFDILEDSYAEQVRGLLDGGVDALLIETCQDILQCKAAIAASERVFAESGRRVPIMVQVTMETTGTMLVGTDIAGAVTALEAFPQVNVIGLNCGTGPQEMVEHVRYLSERCRRYISVMPNAGLPQIVDGCPFYSLEPEELARWLAEFVEKDGVNIVGGCCGTTPEHLARVVEAVRGCHPKQRSPAHEPSVSSLYQSVSICQDNSVLLIGERTNANGSKKFRELLLAEDFDGMVQMGREQAQAGSHMIDVCAAYVGRDEVHDMTRLVSRLATEVQMPLMIDSTDVRVLEAALKLAGGKCVVNSVNLEDGEDRCRQILGLCRRFGAAVVALTIDEEGMARTADRKIAIAHRLYRIATEEFGMEPGDLIFDPLTFTICTGSEADRRLGLETLEGIRRIHHELPGCHTLLGLSNISFGVRPPVRHLLNSVFLHYATEAGLDAAIVHVAGIRPLYKLDENLREIARKLIFDERTDTYDPLADLLAQFPDGAPAVDQMVREDAPLEERLKQRIIDGNRTGLTDDLDEAMRNHAPLEIINEILLPGMKVVGDLFGAGQMQLPFVLQSAETIKAAVNHLEPHMDRSHESGKGTIVLATVRGDVHDIGKNLVDILLTNNGYTVHNLGIKQPINQVIEKWQETGADAIGLSGLLVKSTLVMRDDLAVLNERGLMPPVILGGAALTRKYVEGDLRPLYYGSLFYARDAFEGMALMRRICEGESVASDESDGTRKPGPAAIPSEVASDRDHEPVPAVRATKTVDTRRSDVAMDVPVPVPPFWGSRIVDDVALDDILGFLNEVMLFQVHWQFRKRGRPQEEFDRYLEMEVRPVYRDLIARCRAENILQPRAIYGYWPCQSEGNTLFIYDPLDRAKVLAEITFPRQQAKQRWCLADFWRPRSTKEYDVMAMSIVTAGSRVSEIERLWFEEDRYRDYLYLHGLGVETAEAFAELLHKRIRTEWGIADQDAKDLQKLFQQGYQGSRYSFGYPACPNVEDQLKMWPLLQPERIGVTITDECQLVPEQTTSAIVTHHPEARYFKA